jgi:hypothetical protein
MWIIVTGNPIDGFRFYGPFSSSGDACQWTEDNSKIIDPDWYLAELLRPLGGAE